MRTAIASLLFVALSAQPIFACCGVSTAGHPVRFGTQENIVIYNSKTKTEYFIRNARFTSDAEEFGFIAPSPTEPTITKADPDIFSYLDSKRPVSRNTDGLTTDAAAGGAKGVEVVDIVEVAGYKATILKAGDAKALTAYLKEHNYATSASLEKWTDHYIQKSWYLTAFQVTNKEEALETGVVCMKFKTDRPFNPYYVPQDNIVGSPGLDLSFVSDQVYSPTIGNKDKFQEESWRAKLDSDDMQTLAGYLDVPAAELPADAFLTKYTDDNFPVPDSEDIFFAPRPAALNLIGYLGPEDRGGNTAVKIGAISMATMLCIGVIAKNRRKPGTS